MSKINFTRLLMKMLVGGFIISTTSYIAKDISPVYAGLFWSFPIQLIVLYVFLLYDKTSNSHISQFFLTISFGLINIAAFCITTALLLYHFDNMSPLKVIFFSLISWTIVGYIMFNVITKIINTYY